VLLISIEHALNKHKPKELQMMMNNTLSQLRDLKLAGMACAVKEQLYSAASTGLSFEERLALMVDREVHHRDDKRRAALMKRAGLKYPQACIEDVDSKPGRGFERSSLMSLALSRWVEDGTAILVTGPTGSGKSWLACALAQYACRRRQSALYLRAPRLAEDLRVLHGNGGFQRWLAAVARTDVLLLDDWGLAAMDGPTRADLKERHRHTQKHRRRVTTSCPTTSTTEPANHLQTTPSHNPSHATQHRPLKSVTFTEIRSCAAKPFTSPWACCLRARATSWAFG
jgi:DNA replication protein DnaC